MFGRILIANRGEIALRIIATCRRMGIRTVAVHSEIDARALHVQEADESVLLGPASALASYLAMDRIVEAALDRGCEAIHPGYGFLSEDPRFARRVREAGLVFVGPSPEAMALVGDKIAARDLALRTGLPLVPGCPHPLASSEEVRAAAREVGFPVLLKPAAGGGGKGMRVVRSEADLERALAASRDEARKAFGDDRVFLERYVADPRHVEFQIMADLHGHAIHLGERECSIQRRHQKIIEEAPSVAVGEIQRRRMGRLSCELALAAGYAGAGTVEFIFDQDGNAYFLEMNARLQVEHPVTEAVTGLDLVEWQLRIAAGEPLPLRQEQVELQGWAVEARICAEDPSREFLPSTGMITRYAAPRGPNVRVDSGIAAGSLVSFFYDSLLLKVTARAPTRPAAVESLVQALNACHVEGVVTNLDFVNALLNHPSFVKGDLSTGFIDAHTEGGRVTAPAREEHLVAMVIAAVQVHHHRQAIVRDSLRPSRPRAGPTPGTPTQHRYIVKCGERSWGVILEGSPGSHDWTCTVDGVPHAVVTPEFEFYRRRLRLGIDGVPQYFRTEYQDHFIRVAFRGQALTLEVYTLREWGLAPIMPGPVEPAVENVLRCPMPGLVVRVLAGPGDAVYRGQDLVAIESMKMESLVPSPLDGRVAEVRVRAGQAVETGEVLLSFTE